MSQGHLNQRGDLNAAALAIYTLLFIGVICILIRNGPFKYLSYIYMTVLTIIKIAGAAMTIDVQLTLNSSLYTPAAILSTVVLSPLLIATMEFLNPGFKTQSLISAAFSRLPPNDSEKNQTRIIYSQNNSSGLRKHIPELFNLNRIVILLSLIFGIIGSLKVYGTNVADYDSGKTYIRVAAGFFIAAIVIIWFTLLSLWPERKFFSSFRRRIYVVMACCIAPFLTLRVIYTCGTAFTIDTDKTQVFNPFTGSWILYLCIAWLPEVLCSIFYIGAGLLWAHVE